jgi:hypothetical protein
MHSWPARQPPISKALFPGRLTATVPNCVRSLATALATPGGLRHSDLGAKGGLLIKQAVGAKAMAARETVPANRETDPILRKCIEAIAQLGRRSVERDFELGGWFIQAKTRFDKTLAERAEDDRNWERWVLHNCRYSLNQSGRLMRIAAFTKERPRWFNRLVDLGFKSTALAVCATLPDDWLIRLEQESIRRGEPLGGPEIEQMTAGWLQEQKAEVQAASPNAALNTYRRQRHARLRDCEAAAAMPSAEALREHMNAALIRDLVLRGKRIIRDYGHTSYWPEVARQLIEAFEASLVPPAPVVPLVAAE